VTLTADPSNAATSDATSASFTPPAPGSYCFYAVYSGDANYLGSVDGNADQCFTVTS
jgi:hypothetical protein